MIFKVQRFTVNSHLMYLLQQLTNEPTENILSYFYGTAMTIADNHVNRYQEKNKPIKRLRKILKIPYKGTIVPFKLDVYSSCRSFEQQSGFADIYIDVNFPKKILNCDPSDIITTLTEKSLSLDGAVSLPSFNRPDTRMPLGYKKSINK